MSSTQVTHRRCASRDGMRERTYSDDHLLNAVGWGVVLLSVAAGMGFGFWWIGLQGMMFAGLSFMGMSWGAFEIVEPAIRGHVAERRVRKLLRRYDVPAVHDVFLSTPDGRRAQLDHVPFLGRQVAVIETKAITGTVERKGGVWSRMIHGQERRVPGRTPQQQALDARDVLLAAYPAWGEAP